METRSKYEPTEMELMCENIRKLRKHSYGLYVYRGKGVRVTVYAIGSHVDARTG